LPGIEALARRRAKLSWRRLFRGWFSSTDLDSFAPPLCGRE
jgi:hypothetical protein